MIIWVGQLGPTVAIIVIYYIKIEILEQKLIDIEQNADEKLRLFGLFVQIYEFNYTYNHMLILIDDYYNLKYSIFKYWN